MVINDKRVLLYNYVAKLFPKTRQLPMQMNERPKGIMNWGK